MNMMRRTDIDNRTNIPVFAVVTVLPFLIGAIMWLTSIYESVAEASRVNIAQDRELHEQRALLLEIREHVIRIESQTK